MKIRQRGILEIGLVYGIVAAVIVAAIGGLWAYYSTQNSALRADVKEKQETITNLGTAKSTLTARVAALEGTNSDWAKNADRQNIALAVCQGERKTADALFTAADTKAKAQAKSYEARIAAINAARVPANGDWCGAVGDMLGKYIGERQAK